MEPLKEFLIRPELQPVQPFYYPTLDVLRGHVDDHAVAESLTDRRYQVFVERGVLLIPDALALIGWRQVGVAQDDRCAEPHFFPRCGVDRLSTEPGEGGAAHSRWHL